MGSLMGTTHLFVAQIYQLELFRNYRQECKIDDLGMTASYLVVAPMCYRLLAENLMYSLRSVLVDLPRLRKVQELCRLQMQTPQLK